MPDAVFQARAARSAQLKTRVAWLAIGILSGSVAVGGAWRLLSPARSPQITKAPAESVTLPALAAQAAPMPTSDGAVQPGASSSTTTPTTTSSSTSSSTPSSATSTTSLISAPLGSMKDTRGRLQHRIGWIETNVLIRTIRQLTLTFLEFNLQFVTSQYLLLFIQYRNLLNTLR